MNYEKVKSSCNTIPLPLVFTTDPPNSPTLFFVILADSYFLNTGPLPILCMFQTDKLPYAQLPLQPVKRDPVNSQEGMPTGLPLNIANGAINIDVGRMASGVLHGGGGQNATGGGAGAAAQNSALPGQVNFEIV